MLTLAAEQGHLLTLVDGLPDEEFLPEADDRFYSADRDVQINFFKDGDGEIGGFMVKEQGRTRKVPRIGPLFHSLKPGIDPDPARTENVVTALKAIAQGEKAVDDSPVLTAGARADLRNIADRSLAGLKSVIFLMEQDVSGRAIERHKGGVSRILHYRLVTDKPDRGLLVHLTADGLITDYDIVVD